MDTLRLPRRRGIVEVQSSPGVLAAFEKIACSFAQVGALLRRSIKGRGMARRRTMWGAAFDAFNSGMEAQQVIALRLAKIARGGAAGDAEARLMVDEKVATALHVHQAAFLSLMTGGGASIPATTAATYRRKVLANRRRLLKGG